MFALVQTLKQDFVLVFFEMLQDGHTALLGVGQRIIAVDLWTLTGSCGLEAFDAFGVVGFD